MQVHSKKLSDTKLELSIVADDTQLADSKQHALSDLRRDVKLQGFRAGKAPLSMVEKSVDPNRLQTVFLEDAINRLYVDAVIQEKLRPVSQPKVDLKKFVPYSSLEVTVEVDVIGEITLPNYKKIALPRPVISIEAKEVTNVLNNLRERLADKKSVSRAAKTGDETIIDFTGTDAKTKESIKGADGTDYPLLLGSNSFIPGFEDNIVGMKVGQEKAFDITFPADYGVETLQSRKVNFVVTVKAINAVTLPKLDDAFASKVGPFKTLAELKADVKKQLSSEREAQAERDYENAIVSDLVKKTKLSVPSSVVDEELDSLEREERQNLLYRGQTWEEHLASEGVTETEHREKNRLPAEERVKAGLMLAEIAQEEKITVSDADIDTRVALLKSQYSDQKMQAEIDNPDNRRSIASRIMTEKTLDKLKTYAAK